jgi:N-sulfoglucosamine sulfohydrolase
MVLQNNYNSTEESFMIWFWSRIALVLIFGGLISPVMAQNNEKAKPNIVLIVSDDHGLDALGCYGNPVVQTPHMDRLAAEGVRFSNAFCTTASCSPSRSVILSGKHNHANGTYGLEHTFHHFSSFENIKSLPVYLSEAGYRTARVGKYHVAPEKVFRFETVLSVGAANNMQALGRSPVEMAEKCKALIAAEDDRPFFLYFCMDDPHRGLPFDTWPGPNPFGNRTQGYPGVKAVKYAAKDVIVPPFLPDTPECRAEIAEYYQSVSRADQGIGRLIEILQNERKYESTIVIYISDNGIAFPGAKTTLYDSGMRLPCIVKIPWLKQQGVVNHAMISWVDITPTILDFAGVSNDTLSFDGRSFKPVLYGDVQSREEIYASHTFHEVTMYYPMRVVRTRKYKLIWNIAHKLEFPFARDLWESSTWQSVIRNDKDTYAGRPIDAFINRPEFELYDLEADPAELNNIAADPQQAKTVVLLQKKLQKFQEDTNDPWRVKWYRQ